MKKKIYAIGLAASILWFAVFFQKARSWQFLEKSKYKFFLKPRFLQKESFDVTQITSEVVTSVQMTSLIMTSNDY